MITCEHGGKVRNADMGLLYDPARPGEADLCERWQASLRACAPVLTIRRDYTYAGKDDGLTAWLRRRLPPGAYAGTELEVNRKPVLGAWRQWSALREVILESLRHTLASRRGETSPWPTPSVTTATRPTTACPALRRRPAGAPP